jgi:hypothetical protein
MDILDKFYQYQIDQINVTLIQEDDQYESLLFINKIDEFVSPAKKLPKSENA